MDNIPYNLQNVERSLIESMVNEMINEMQRDYYDSVRKSILDYVLKDDSERLRVGIMETFDEVVDYGESVYKGIEADDDWKLHFHESYEEIKNNLVINSKETLNLMCMWEKYEKMHFLVLPNPNDYMTIQSFIDI